ncbi:hypothetical protein AB5I39_08565 [Sphingomonas sp. MMS24-J45]|uniref:hypothetical protein n=1 Tax=Sphingomonas sp. MMS24-J45 TaxID=3238806 RepID=UPI00384E0707
MKSAALAAEVPISTALRWVDTLCREGVLLRWKDPVDRRRSFLELSASSRIAMAEFASIVGL